MKAVHHSTRSTPPASMTRFSSKSGGPEALLSGANDVIVTRLGATSMQVHVGKLASWSTFLKSREGQKVFITVNGKTSDTHMVVADSGACQFPREDHPLTLTQEEWCQLGLHQGANPAVYSVPAMKIEIPFTVYWLDQDTELVLTDIDGTITTSDFEGIVMPAFGNPADQAGVVELFHKKNVAEKQLIYLTARPMGESEPTKKYLFKTLQDIHGYSMPDGPVFLIPKEIFSASVQAVLAPEKQKADILGEILQLFEKGPEVVESAYGNRASDTKAYLAAGVEQEKIFLVNRQGFLRNTADGSVSSYTVEATKTEPQWRDESVIRKKIYTPLHRPEGEE